MNWPWQWRRIRREKVSAAIAWLKAHHYEDRHIDQGLVDSAILFIDGKSDFFLGCNFADGSLFTVTRPPPPIR